MSSSNILLRKFWTKVEEKRRDVEKGKEENDQCIKCNQRERVREEAISGMKEGDVTKTIQHNTEFMVGALLDLQIYRSGYKQVHQDTVKVSPIQKSCPLPTRRQISGGRFA